MKRSKKASPVDVFLKQQMARYGSLSEALAHFPRLGDFDHPDGPIEKFTSAWLGLAEEAWNLMAEDGDPGVGISDFCEPGRRPVTVLFLLGGITKCLIRAASYRHIDFAQPMLWEFVGSVHQWSLGDRGPAVYSKASERFHIARTELDRITDAHNWMLRKGGSKSQMPASESAANGRSIETAGHIAAKPRKPTQTRLKAVLDSGRPYLLLDGIRVDADEVGVRYVDALITANGGRVSFVEWVENHSAFEGAIVTRVLNKLPKIIEQFVEHTGGKPSRLKVELLVCPQELVQQK
jgi:hypothetical protein